MTERKSSNIGGAIDRVTDAVGGAVGFVSAVVSGHDELMFVTNARVSDLYEIAAAEIVLARSHSPELRRYAEAMIADHRNSIRQMDKALIGKEVKAPNALDARRQTMVEHLRDASDEAFEETYVKQQRAAHREAMTLFDGYASTGAGTSLGAYAAGAVPVIKQHGDLLERAQSA